MSKLTVNVGNDFPLDGTVAEGRCLHPARHHHHGECRHHHHSAHLAREYRALRAEFKQAWHEKIHALRHGAHGAHGGKGDDHA